MKTVKFLNGWYRLSGEHYFSNIKREGRTWTADVRYSHSGDLRRYAGIWPNKAEAIEEATHIINRLDALFVEGDLN